MSNLANTCGAMTTSGNPCRRVCADGFTRCNLHGGHTPLARQAAQETLARAALPSARVPLEIVSRWLDKRCATCGHPTGDPMPALRAAQMVLDRTGFHPTLTVQTPATPTADYRAWIPQERMEIMAAWLAEARAACERGEPEPAIDAVLVEDDEAQG